MEVTRRAERESEKSLGVMKKEKEALGGGIGSEIVCSYLGSAQGYLEILLSYVPDRMNCKKLMITQRHLQNLLNPHDCG